MKRRKLSRRARIEQFQLRLEQLEQRQLLAADLVTNPLDTSSLIDTNQASSLVAGSQDTQSNMSLALRSPQPGLLIPHTTAGVRSIDGTNNNLENPDFGSAGTQLLRIAAADYADGVAELAGVDRPSAREISNAIAAQDPEAGGNERGLSAFVYVWGQFLDHDIDLSETGTTEAEFVEVPTDDPYFDPNGTGTQSIVFFRSLFDPDTGTGVDNPREQINAITAYIDGSQIYGSDQATADSLRAFVGGKLLIGDADLLPTDDEGNFLAGDIRANENIELTSMHTLFVREHNWWADRIASQNPNLTDEQIYQQARAIVIAEIQAITFEEFLPALLGEGTVVPYRGYDASVNPGIANEFSTAAFRLGHSLLNDDVEFFGNDGRAVAEEVELAEAFFNPALIREHGIDSVLKYAASSQSQEIDTHLVDSVRNFLFGEPGQGGLDLASLNIQRGRDHGLADYNIVRAAYGLDRVSSFTEITSDVELQQQLSELYDTVDEIDLWVGLLSEDHVPGGSVGETMRTIIVDQFTRLRDGDRFWYENIFSGRQLDQLRSTSLSDVIRRNTTVENLQENVFFMQAEVNGRVFVDTNANGQLDRRERPLSGVTLELLDDEGEVAAITQSDSHGFYFFEDFLETGDYQVRVIAPDGYTASSDTTTDLLISRGDLTIKGVNFAMTAVKNTTPTNPRRPGSARNQTTQSQHLVDQAFAGGDVSDLAGLVDTLSREQAQRRGRRA